MWHLKPILLRGAAVIAALLVWQAAASLLDLKLILVSPLAVAERLSTIWREPGFFETILFSFSRIVTGFFSGLLAGIVLGLLAGRFRLVETLLWPYMVTVKSIPVASFIIIALIWLSAASLSIFISFLMVLPIVYTNVLNGIRAESREMREMATVFRLSPLKRLLYLWVPQMKPYLLSAASVSLGLAWKSGIAAEIIGIPGGSMGEALYYAKVYLNTVDLFAWTVVIVLLSVGFEKLFLALLKAVFKGVEAL